MDTLIFALLTVSFVFVVRKNARWAVLGWWATCLVLTAVLFAIHVSDPLDLSF